MSAHIIPLALERNSPLSYGLAALFLALGLVVASLGRRLALAVLDRHRLSEAPLRRAFAALVHSTWPLMPAALGVGAANQVLDLPGATNGRIDIAVLLLATAQAGYWGHSLVDFALTLWFDRHATVDAATRSGRGMLRFAGTTAVWTLALMLGFRALNISISGLAAGLGVFGVAVTLATQSLVGDLFASLSILLDKPFLVGDTIATGSINGRVERIGARTTRLRNVSGEEVVVPNSDLIRTRLHNFRTLRERRIVFGLNVRYETSPTQLRDAAQVVRRAIEGCHKVRFDRAELLSFGDVGLRFEVVYFICDPDFALYTATQERINLAIIEGFWRLGVGFAHTSRGSLPPSQGEPAAPAVDSRADDSKADDGDASAASAA